MDTLIGMSATVCSLILFAASGWAGELSDYTAVESAVAGLNNRTTRAALFTKDADGRAMLEQLLRPRVPLGLQAPVPMPVDTESTEPTIVRVPGLSLELAISHEPMGEAQLRPIPWPPVQGFYGLPTGFGPAGPTNIISRNIRFITPDVAVVDASIQARPPSPVRFSTPDLARVETPIRTLDEDVPLTDVVLVMVKSDGRWLVAVARRAIP